MANPTMSDLQIVSRPLTLVANNYAARLDKMIADKVFPVIPVDDQTGDYYQFARGDWFRIEARERAPGTESAGAGFRISQADLYHCRRYALHKDVDDPTVARQNAVFNVEQSSTQFVTQNLFLLREQKWASSFFKTGVWGRELTGKAATPGTDEFLQWDNADATPVALLRAERLKMMTEQGYAPNVLVIGAVAWDALIEHPSTVERFKTANGLLPEDAIKRWVGVDRIVIPEVVVNSAAEGAADAFGSMYGKHAMLAYASDTPSIQLPSAGYIFAWRGLLGAGAYNVRMKRFRMEEIESFRIEGELAFDMRIVTPDLGTFFKDIIA